MSFLKQLCFDAMNSRKYDYAKSYRYPIMFSKYASQARNASYFIDSRQWYRRLVSLFINGNAAQHYKVKAIRFTLSKWHDCPVAYLLFEDRSILRLYDDSGVMVIKLIDRHGCDYVKAIVTKYADNAEPEPEPVAEPEPKEERSTMFKCLLYPHPYCGNCAFSCNNENGDPCPDWTPCRGAHPSTPNPCEFGGDLNTLCFGICNSCPKAKRN